MPNIKVIVFDFDGVIVDSNALKYNAFFKLFPESDANAQNAVKEATDSARNKNRFRILREIFRKFGKSANEIENLVSRYAEEYNKKVQQGIIKKGFMPGALQSLKNLSAKYALYINSLTPEFALKEAVENLGIGRFLKGVYGQTSSLEEAKESNLRKIMDLEKVDGENVLVVGDGEVDYQSSKACKCSFMGIVNEFNGWEDTGFPLLYDLTSIDSAIDRL